MSNIEQGLGIMVLGLTITFGALAIFIGIILLLQRLFPPEQAAEGGQEKDADPPATRLSARDDTTEEEIAVAITVALAQLYSYELCRSNLGISLEQGHSPWWSAGRLEETPLDIVPVQGRN